MGAGRQIISCILELAYIMILQLTHAASARRIKQSLLGSISSGSAWRKSVVIFQQLGDYQFEFED
jgi:hypothetical protein